MTGEKKQSRIVLRTRDGEYLHEIQPRPEWGPVLSSGSLQEATTYSTKPSEEYRLRQIENTWTDDPRSLQRVRVTVVSYRKVELA